MKTWSSPLSRQLCGDLSFQIFGHLNCNGDDRVHAAVQPLAEWARSAQSPSAHRIAVVKDLAFIAALSALLRWPDIHQAAACTLGFRIVSDIKSSNEFRELQPSTANGGTQAFLDCARECDKMTRRPAPEHADDYFPAHARGHPKQHLQQVCSRMNKSIKCMESENGGRLSDLFTHKPVANRGPSMRQIRVNSILFTTMGETICTIGTDWIAEAASVLQRKHFERGAQNRRDGMHRLDHAPAGCTLEMPVSS